jgi:hypothetical protein
MCVYELPQWPNKVRAQYPPRINKFEISHSQSVHVTTSAPLESTDYTSIDS